MNKRLTALTTTTLLALGVAATAPAQALPIFGTESDHELQDIVDGTVDVDGDQYMKLDSISGRLSISMVDLLNDPGQMDGLYAGDSVDKSNPPEGLDVYQKEGCYVQAGCALKAIGLANTLKCASSGTDPEAWAYCVQDKDYDAYIAATECTWGDCPGFASVPGEGLYACTDPTGESVLSAFSSDRQSLTTSAVY